MLHHRVPVGHLPVPGHGDFSRWRTPMIVVLIIFAHRSISFNYSPQRAESEFYFNTKNDMETKSNIFIYSLLYQFLCGLCVLCVNVFTLPWGALYRKLP
jgi:hypothetical protein